MKKACSILLALLLCLTLAACAAEPQKVPEADATDGEKQAVIDAAKDFFASETFANYVQLYKDTFGEDAAAPEIINALTFRCEVEGYDLDLLLFNVKADAAVDINGEIFGADMLQFAVDRTDGTVYDSLSNMEFLNSFTGNIDSYEAAVLCFLNSGVLMNNTDDYIWSEHEEGTRFTQADIDEINAAIAE